MDTEEEKEIALAQEQNENTRAVSLINTYLKSVCDKMQIERYENYLKQGNPYTLSDHVTYLNNHNILNTSTANLNNTIV